MIFSFWVTFIVAFALVRFFIALFNLFTQPYLKRYSLHSADSVSILIPARNEETNIRNLLSDLQRQTYPNIEVTVYNDLSEDSTGKIVEEFVKQDNRFQLINGNDLPDGWLGKNNACHRLAMQANGKYLLFLDADVRIHKSFVEYALAYMQHKKLHFFSFCPYQILGSLGEAITVPVMLWILLSLLPLKWVMWSRYKSLSAAVGQMMMFRADIYKKHEFHKMFRDNPVEDINIARKVKELNYQMAILLGTPRDIQCRMYFNGKDAVRGFARSVHEFFGGHRFLMLIYAAITTLGPFIVIASMHISYIMIYFFSLIMAHIFIAILSKHNILKSVLFSPLLQVSFIQMVILWEKNRRQKNLLWKGRKLKY